MPICRLDQPGHHLCSQPNTTRQPRNTFRKISLTSLNQMPRVINVDKNLAYSCSSRPYPAPVSPYSAS